MEQNNLKCPICGGILIADGDDMVSTIIETADPEAIVSYYTCSECHRKIHIFE